MTQHVLDSTNLKLPRKAHLKLRCVDNANSTVYFLVGSEMPCDVLKIHLTVDDGRLHCDWDEIITSQHLPHELEPQSTKAISLSIYQNKLFVICKTKKISTNSMNNDFEKHSKTSIMLLELDMTDPNPTWKYSMNLNIPEDKLRDGSLISYKGRLLILTCFLDGIRLYCINVDDQPPYEIICIPIQAVDINAMYGTISTCGTIINDEILVCGWQDVAINQNGIIAINLEVKNQMKGKFVSIGTDRNQQEEEDWFLISNNQIILTNNYVIEGVDEQFGISGVGKINFTQNLDGHGFKCYNNCNESVARFSCYRDGAIFYVGGICRIILIKHNDDQINQDKKYPHSITLTALDDVDDIMGRHDQSKIFKCNKKYEVGKKIGSGATSLVYDAVLNERKLSNGTFRKEKDLNPYQLVIIKQENQIEYDKISDNDGSDSELQQHTEKDILTKIGQNKYISNLSCKLIDSFIENGVSHLVLSKLGVTLQQLFNLNSKQFSITQVCGIMNRMITILYKLHSIGFVHNDIKPENILIGNNRNINKLYLIDFGLAKPFWDFITNGHILAEYNVEFEGTYRFSSFNHHCNTMNQSRRDDLESLIYVALYFLNVNSLPWTKIDTSEIRYETDLLQQTKQVKNEADIDDICQDAPEVFKIALKYIRNLKFDEMPDYIYLQSLFQTLLEQQPSVKDLYRTKTSFAKQLLGAWMEKTKIDYSSMNNKMIDEYNNNLRVESDRTKYNEQTHYSVRGLVNRSNFKIESLIISNDGCGIPASKPKPNTKYGGIIVYELANNDTIKNSNNSNNSKNNTCKSLNGRIYMLEGSICDKTNDEYFRQHGKRFNSQCHDAVYYYHFGEQVCKKDKEFIRGFAVDGTPDGGIEFKFRSGAFNWTGLCLKDKKYRELSRSEKAFVEYALLQHWDSRSSLSQIKDVISFQSIIHFTDFQETLLNSNDSKLTKKEDIYADHVTHMSSVAEEKDLDEKQDTNDIPARMKKIKMKKIKHDTLVGDIPAYTIDKLLQLYQNVKKNELEFDQSKQFRGNKKFKIIKQIGAGERCAIYDALVNGNTIDGVTFRKEHNLGIKKLVIIKEDMSVNPKLDDSNPLWRELNNYTSINRSDPNQDWTCKLFEAFMENGKLHLVLSKFNSLDCLSLSKNKTLKLREICTIIVKMIAILYKLHSLGFIHNNIAPENIRIRNKSLKRLCLIHFSEMSSYWDFSTNNYKSESTSQSQPQTIFNDEKIAQSRRGDLSLLIYVAIYLHEKGSKTKSFDTFLHKKIPKNRRETFEGNICKGMPRQFSTALKYLKKLKNIQQPDYQWLQSLFVQISDDFNYKPLDWKFFGARTRSAGAIYSETELECKLDNIVNNKKYTITKTMVRGYNEKTERELDNTSNSVDLIPYKNVYLPIDPITRVIDYLDRKSRLKLLLLCEQSNKFMKYLSFCKPEDIFVARVYYIANGNCSDGDSKENIDNHLHKFNIGVTKVDKTRIDTSKINFSDLSIVNEPRNTIVVFQDNSTYNWDRDREMKADDHDIDEKNCIPANIDHDLEFKTQDYDRLVKFAKHSLLHYNRLHIVSQCMFNYDLQLLKSYRKMNLDSINEENLSFKLISVAMDENKDDTYTNDNYDTGTINIENESILWYWKTSDKNVNSWQKYDNETQKEIESAFSKNKKSMVVLTKGRLYSDVNNSKFYGTYAILFNDECEKMSITKKSHMFHSISNSKWRYSFTKYFYQKQLVLNKYRIVKRVDHSKKRKYVECVHKIIQEYF